MTPIRVFLVDDSSVVRRLVSDALTGDPEVMVVGTAPNGKTALARFPQVHPDLIVMDVEMPEMDGLQTLSAIRKLDRHLPVIMFSTETRRGAAATLDALALGASDYVTKPVNSGGTQKAIEYVRNELLPKIKALCAPRYEERSRAGLSGERSGIALPPERPSTTPLSGDQFPGLSERVATPEKTRHPVAVPPREPTVAPRPGHQQSRVVTNRPGTAATDPTLTASHSWPPLPARVSNPIPKPVKERRWPAKAVEVVVVGVSTGGPAALGEFLPALPATLPVPVLIVLHMPPMFTRLLAERLAESCSLPVHEAVDGEPVRAGHVYLAPGGYHMVLQRDSTPRIVLNQDAPENHCRPAVDVLFRSVVKAYGAATLAIVLTGMGQDGKNGCELIRAAGGQVVVQDQASSVVWGMPGAIARGGLADEVLPLSQIPSAVTRRLPATSALAPTRLL